MKITFGMNTAQEDFPIVAYPKTHIFEFLMQSLRRQTFKDFEVIIADVHYDKRANYFDNHKENFSIKHVAVKPNIWIPNGCCAISTTKNTFLIYAQGEIVISMGDCAHFDSRFFERIIEYIENGYDVVGSLYTINQGPDIVVTDQRNIESKDIHGNVAMSMKNWEYINGYDEMFDGAKGVEDSDLGWRCEDVGLKIKLIEPRIIYQNHQTCKIVTNHNQLKCQDRWWHFARHRSFCGIPANTVPVTNKEFDFLCECYRTEKMLEKCNIHGTPCKFKNKEELSRKGINYNLLTLYKHPSLIFNLREQRKDAEKTIEYLKEACNDN